MKGETPAPRNPRAMLSMTGIVILAVGYMYWQFLKGYLAGGPDAPSLATVIAGGVLLGGGCIVVAYMAVRIYRQSKKKPDGGQDGGDLQE